MDSDAFVRVLFGPLGSGKSSGCIMEIVRRAAEQAKDPKDGVRHTRAAIIRNTGPQLRDTTRKTFEAWIPDGVLGRWAESDFTFWLRTKDLECEILFRALDRPEDVKKVLSLDLTFAYINELREIPKEIFDGIQGRLGRFPAKKDGGPTWFGLWADTNPWAKGTWGNELFDENKPPPGFELFEQPSGLSPEAENVDNLPGDYYQRLCLGKDQSWIEEYVKGLRPAADRGSVYGDLIAKLEEERGVLEFQHPKDGVFAVFDLGVSDATAIWWFRINRFGLPDIIDWYEATGRGADHYLEVLDGKTPEGVDRPRDYKLLKVWLPHDARARTFQTGISTVEQFEKWSKGSEATSKKNVIDIVPELDVADGITAARWLLGQPMRFHARCAPGLKLLRAYRYQWDERKKVFSRDPLHNFASHTADCFRYVACAYRASGHFVPKESSAPAANARPTYNITLDELFKTATGPKKRSRVP